MAYVAKRPPLDPCPVEAVVALVGGKWKSRLMLELKSGPRRLAQLRPALPCVSTQVLLTQLGAMEADGLVAVSYTCRGTVRARVYALSESGRDLLPVLDRMAEWGLRHIAARGQDWQWPTAPLPRSSDRAGSPDAGSPDGA